MADMGPVRSADGSLARQMVTAAGLRFVGSFASYIQIPEPSD